MSDNLLSLNPSKTEFLLVGLPHQLAKLNTDRSLNISDDITIQPVPSAKNLGFILDSHLSLSTHITQTTRSCYMHIRDLRRIRPHLDFKTASTIATSIVQSKLDYCNSLFFKLPSSQLNRLQLVQNSLARAITRTPKFCHISPVLKSLHWLKIRERTQYKMIAITYNTIQSGKPHYLYDLISFQPPGSTRSSSHLTLQRPENIPRLKICERAFQYAVPPLWNTLPHALRTFSTATKPHKTDNSPVPPRLEMPPNKFFSALKTHLFLKSYPP
jgi:hypothetical protein